MDVLLAVQVFLPCSVALDICQARALLELGFHAGAAARQEQATHSRVSAAAKWGTPLNSSTRTRQFLAKQSNQRRILSTHRTHSTAVVYRCTGGATRRTL